MPLALVVAMGIGIVIEQPAEQSNYENEDDDEEAEKSVRNLP